MSHSCLLLLSGPARSPLVIVNKGRVIVRIIACWNGYPISEGLISVLRGKKEEYRSAACW